MHFVCLWILKYVSRETLNEIINKKQNPPFGGFRIGGPKESRTPDLCNANAALYQLSYRPVYQIQKVFHVKHLI
jgi:hypothetical protein